MMSKRTVLKHALRALSLMREFSRSGSHSRKSRKQLLMYGRALARALLRAQRRHRRAAKRASSSISERQRKLALRRQPRQGDDRNRSKTRCRSSANCKMWYLRKHLTQTSCAPKTVRYAEPDRATPSQSGNAACLRADESAVRTGGRMIFSWFVSAFTAGFAAWLYAINSTLNR
ncbi:hypothetical protein BKA63DRAFT_196299 [Paraphoma chrysanthemicola]|nr:hypothetical protein BKA63DRAFT_196299 [Paraphoma chrysanthemicola]